jgi:hypothetical protein
MNLEKIGFLDTLQAHLTKSYEIKIHIL